MSMTTFITKYCTQIAVYWGNPVQDTYGYTFDAPVEIMCRWINKSEILIDDKGEQILSKAIVHILQDMSINGYLYLGTLDSLDSDNYSYPEKVTGAYSIKKIDKVPSINQDAFVRRAYL
jgi:hypothetical protein